MIWGTLGWKKRRETCSLHSFVVLSVVVAIVTQVWNSNWRNNAYLHGRTDDFLFILERKIEHESWKERGVDNSYICYIWTTVNTFGWMCWQLFICRKKISKHKTLLLIGLCWYTFNSRLCGSTNKSKTHIKTQCTYHAVSGTWKACWAVLLV